MRGHPCGHSRSRTRCELFVLSATQQVPHLGSVEQTGDAQVIGLLVTTGWSCGTERRAVEDHLVEFGVRAEELEAVVGIGGLAALAIVGLIKAERLAMRLAQHMVALGFEFAGQLQQ